MDYKFGYFFNDKKDNVQSFEKIKEVLNDCDTSVRKKNFRFEKFECD
ncbi:hypothetical protein [Pediococcus acidilactici]|nr:hypothetical protein [Pediococcus acidilactici]